MNRGPASGEPRAPFFPGANGPARRAPRTTRENPEVVARNNLGIPLQARLRSWSACGALAAAAALVTFPAAIPGAPAGMRTSEILSAAGILALLYVCVFRRALHRAAATLAIALAFSAAWMLVELLNVASGQGSEAARMILARWILSLPCAYWLAAGMASQRYRRALALGLVAGALLSLGTVYRDRRTFDPKADPAAREGSEPVWIDGQYRAAGIFSHPNAAAGVVLLATPLIVGAIEEQLLGRGFILLAMALVASVYSLTMTRGPTLVAAGIVAAHLVRRAAIRSLAAALICAALAVLAWSALGTSSFGSEPLLQRLDDRANLEAGAQDRAMTTFTSLEIAVAHPFGVGSRYERMLDDATGFSATHNGYVQLALLGGLPLMGFIAASLFGHGNPLRGGAHRIEAWTAVYVAGALMFENQFFVSTFSVFVLWLLWDPVSGGPAAIGRRRIRAARRGDAGPDAGMGEEGLRHARAR